MLFHTSEFALFLALVVFLTILSPRFLIYPLLTLASYIFYGWGAGVYTILLAFTSLLDYTIALKFYSKPKLQRYGIIFSALMNFGVLAYFKYANFAISNIDFLFSSFGGHSQFSLVNVILPLGISFYTFQSFAYVVDVLTGKIKPCTSLAEYLLFSSWFPQLIAGPISRANMLMPQLEKLASLREKMAERLPEATILFAEGWIRKSFADLASIPANYFFNQDITTATGSAACYGIIAFGFQIYGDFSGYTRMAQGVSWLFGVRLIDNFNIPYAADSIRDFWRRWHISLSLWFRDYLYIPLGGNRHGVMRTYFNLALTMMLCGLWHGANWTFILWGALHGGMLIVERVGESFQLTIPKLVRHGLVVLFVFLAWVPFRAPDIKATLLSYEALLHPGWQLPPLNLLIALLGISLTDCIVRIKPITWATSSHQIARASAWIVSCISVWQLGVIIGLSQGATFIYFQF